MSGAFEKELKAMDSAWANAPEGFADLPEGIYTMQISEASIKKTKTSGKPRATFRYVVTEGEHLGSSMLDGFVLDPENPTGMSILKTLLGRKLGYEIPESLSEVEDILADISTKNPIVSVQVVKKGDFTNARVLEMIGEGGGDDTRTPEEAAAGGDDAAPPETPEAAADETPSFKVGDAVSFENDGKTETGKITKALKSGAFSVETEEAVWDEIPADLLSLVEGEQTAEAVDEDPELDALVGFCVSQGIDGIEGLTKEGVIKKLAGMKWTAAELTKGERDLLTKHGIKITAAAAAKPSAAIGKPTAKPKAAAPAPAAKAKSKCKACGGSGKNSKGKPCPICSAKK